MHVARGRILAISLLLTLTTLSAGAQTSKPAGVDSASGSVPQLKMETKEVLVDVVVMDSRGNPVKTCTQKDFQVFEDGKPQNIRYFQPHQAAPTAISAKPLQLPPNVYTNFQTAPESDAVYVILLDMLNTPVADQAYAREEIVKYLKKLAPGQRVAIFALTDELRMLQGFTSDPSLLLKLLQSKALMPGNKSGLSASGDDLAAMYRDLDGLATVGAPSTVMDSIKHFRQDQMARQTAQRVQMTMEAMQALSRYLAGIPGRKNLLWFSASFPLSLLPNPDGDLSGLDGTTSVGGSNSLLNVAEFSTMVRRTASLMAESRIAVYPIDPRGMLAMMESSGLDHNTRWGSYATSREGRTQRDMQVTGEMDSMKSLAKETGGQAFFNTNDLQKAMSEVVANGSSYYTLAYAPTNKAVDEKLRRIDIKIQGQPYTLEFRHGYYLQPPAPQSSSEEPKAQEAYHTAMRDGYPPSTQIIFKAQVLPVSLPPDQAAAKAAAGVKGPTRRYQIGLITDVSSLRLTTTADGVRHGFLVVGAVAYGLKGEVLNSATQVMPVNLSLPEYRKALQFGLLYHQELDIPAQDANLRIGVYDPASQNAGTVEIALAQPRSGASSGSPGK